VSDARAPDRALERHRLYRANVPIDAFDLSFSAGMATTRIGSETYSYDLLPARAEATPEPPVLRAALDEIARNTPFVNAIGHDFVGHSPSGIPLAQLSG
jgi:hypothetical protein